MRAIESYLMSHYPYFSSEAEDDVGMVLDMETGRWFEWPADVVIVGLRGHSVGSFPGRRRFMGQLLVHHDLAMMLPVEFLG